MKTPFKLLASAGAAAMLLASPGLQAESTYGYQSSGSGAVSATAKVNVSITVPKLILLRVGADSTSANTVALAVAPTEIPGGVTAALTSGNSQESGWDGTAPTMAVTTLAAARTLTATAWTNATGAGLTGAVTSPFDATSGLTAADVVVTSDGDLAHPGANTGAFGAGTVPSPFTTTTIPRNTVRTATWTYSLSAAGLAAAAAGTHSQTVTYTASAL